MFSDIWVIQRHQTFFLQNPETSRVHRSSGVNLKKLFVCDTKTTLARIAFPLQICFVLVFFGEGLHKVDLKNLLITNTSLFCPIVRDQNPRRLYYKTFFGNNGRKMFYSTSPRSQLQNFFNVTNKEAQLFIPSKFSEPSVIFANKAGASLSGTTFGHSLLRHALLSKSQC